MSARATGPRFFSALREYSRRPTGVFDVLPIADGKSIVKTNCGLAAVPTLRSVTIPAVNYHTILLTERSAKAVSDTLEQFLR